MLSHFRKVRSLQGGFTLIEVLVVVAIIALLIGILLPSLKQARQQANSTVCLSNLKQLGIAMTYYGSDSKGYLPPLRLPYSVEVSGGAGTVEFPYQFQYLPHKYLFGEFDVSTCPVDEFDEVNNGGKRGPYPNLKSGALEIFYSYGMNSSLPKKAYPVYNDVPHPAESSALKVERWNPSKLGAVKYPSECIYLFETAADHTFNGRTDLNRFRTNHGSRQNRMSLLFTDAHAELKQIKEIWPGDFSTTPPTTNSSPPTWEAKFKKLWFGNPRSDGAVNY